jgi:hypothetical protein
MQIGPTYEGVASHTGTSEVSHQPRLPASVVDRPEGGCPEQPHRSPPSSWAQAHRAAKRFSGLAIRSAALVRHAAHPEALREHARGSEIEANEPFPLQAGHFPGSHNGGHDADRGPFGRHPSAARLAVVEGGSHAQRRRCPSDGTRSRVRQAGRRGGGLRPCPRCGSTSGVCKGKPIERMAAPKGVGPRRCRSFLLQRSFSRGPSGGTVIAALDPEKRTPWWWAKAMPQSWQYLALCERAEPPAVKECRRLLAGRRPSVRRRSRRHGRGCPRRAACSRCRRGR